MAQQVRIRRGTTSEHSAFTGAQAELTVDTTKTTLVVHDGSTAGGVPLAKETHTHDGYAASDHTHTGTYEPADATILKDADIGTTVQAYDATLLKSADIGSTVQAYDATILKSADIGTTVQAYDADTAKLDAAQSFSAAQTFDGGVIITDELRETPTVANTSTAYTVAITSGTLFDLTLTGNCTFTFPTATAGRQFTLFLKQDATGSRTITWPSSVRWAGGTAPTITSTASRTDVISFVADGTYWLGFVGGQNYTRA